MRRRPRSLWVRASIAHCTRAGCMKIVSVAPRGYNISSWLHQHRAGIDDLVDHIDVLEEGDEAEKGEYGRKVEKAKTLSGRRLTLPQTLSEAEKLAQGSKMARAMSDAGADVKVSCSNAEVEWMIKHGAKFMGHTLLFHASWLGMNFVPFVHVASTPNEPCLLLSALSKKSACFAEVRTTTVPMEKSVVVVAARRRCGQLLAMHASLGCARPSTRGHRRRGRSTPGGRSERASSSWSPGRRRWRNRAKTWPRDDEPLRRLASGTNLDGPRVDRTLARQTSAHGEGAARVLLVDGDSATMRMGMILSDAGAGAPSGAIPQEDE